MPTNALELLEVSAVRRGLAEGLVEQRKPPQAPLDVLLQHLTSLACGPGFDPEATLAAVRIRCSLRRSNTQPMGLVHVVSRAGR